MTVRPGVALITGGTGGIGRATALRLAREGVDVAFTYLSNAADAAVLSADVARLGVQVGSYRCDVRNAADVAGVVKSVTSELGSVDYLINNAGVIRDNLTPSIVEADFDLVVDTSLKGAFNMISSCYFGFIRRRTGAIVNVSSVAGLCGNPGQSNYAAAKAGMIGLTKSVARELAERNVRCNAIAPGLIETGMSGHISDDARRLDAIPMKRAGTPDEVAALIAFLVGEESAYITGEVIRIDGGLAT